MKYEAGNQLNTMYAFVYEHNQLSAPKELTVIVFEPRVLCTKYAH